MVLEMGDKASWWLVGVAVAMRFTRTPGTLVSRHIYGAMAVPRD